MPGGRRFGRSSSSRPPPPTLPSTFSNEDTHKSRCSGNVDSCLKSISPKHIPIPSIPEDGSLRFESLMFFLTGAGLFLQYLHLYRTVWWLPHSHTTHSMKLYLIDPYLVGFIVLMLSRRLVYTVLAYSAMMFAPRNFWPLVQQLMRFFVLIIMLVLLAWCSYVIIENSPFINLFILYYPIIVYFITFGCCLSPFFDVNSSTATIKADYKMRTYDGKPLHSCTTSAQLIREEVDMLKIDFNSRMKQILFSSIMNAYYVVFVPCCFAQSFLYYDVYWIMQHLIFVWFGSFTMYTSYCYTLRYYDVLHRASIHLGRWIKMEGRTTHLPTHVWADSTLWQHGTLVKHCKELYKAEGQSNAAEPGNVSHARFYAYFSNPTLMLSNLLCLQMVVIVTQFILLVKSAEWYRIISLSFLLFINYCTLFKVIRDYLVAGKIYKTEQLFQEKAET